MCGTEKKKTIKRRSIMGISMSASYPQTEMFYKLAIQDKAKAAIQALNAATLQMIKDAVENIQDNAACYSEIVKIMYARKSALVSLIGDF